MSEEAAKVQEKTERTSESLEDYFSSRLLK